MPRRRALALAKETLTELGARDLRVVVGADVPTLHCVSTHTVLDWCPQQTPPVTRPTE